MHAVTVAEEPIAGAGSSSSVEKPAEEFGEEDCDRDLTGKEIPQS
uniref:Uncharacterized protein n=1 Tax=Brassica oleracea TaxID=3712 RepID=A0A3P6GSK2_BRAOL|nr:unnamed protein product [Brassica oleracea]